MTVRFNQSSLGLFALLTLAACSSGSQTADLAASVDAATYDAAGYTGPWNDPPDAGPPDAGGWRTALSSCWTDVSCHRAMLVSHGGDWDFMMPYDSRGALARAVQRGADGIKADLRVTADNVAVVTHSSPIQIYESFDCAGKYIEKMTAAEVTACHLLGTAYTFQRVSDLLGWAHGRTVVMLDVKVASDLPRAITTAIENHAEDDLFLEVHVQDFLSIVVGAPGWERIHYLVWLGSPDDADMVIKANHKQGFMFEMDPTYPAYDAAAMKTLIDTKIHPAGFRAFTSTDKNRPTVENHQMLFDEDFDVVMTYDLTAGLTVRQKINTARGISPP